jgi:ATP-dependent Clp protease, protease subunit
MKHLAYVILLILVLSTALAKEPVKEINLTEDNTVIIRGAIDEVSTTTAILEVYKLVWKRSLFSTSPIYLVLDSPGGSVSDGSALIESLKTIPHLKTITLFGASMAHAIAQALPGERYVLSNSEMMAHRAKGRFGGQFETGEVETRLNHWKKLIRKMEQTNADRIGVPLSEYKQKVINEWWEFGENLVSSGFADEVVTLSCSKALTEKEVKVTTQSMFGGVKVYSFSGCPLLRSPIP